MMDKVAQTFLEDGVDLDKYNFFSLFQKPYNPRCELVTHNSIIYYDNTLNTKSKLLEIIALDEPTLRKVGVLTTYKDKNGIMWIDDVAVAPGYRKRRIATNLILLAIDNMPYLRVPYGYGLSEVAKGLIEHCRKVQIIKPENLGEVAELIS